MLRKRNASMTIGISMDHETCQILGQVSHNLLYSTKNFPTDLCGPGERLTRTQLASRPDHLCPELWKKMGKNAKLKEKQKWSNEKSIWITHGNCEESFSSTRRIRNSKKPSRTRVRSWKHQWLLLCPVKLPKIVGVVHPTKFRQNLCVFWKLMNLQDCVREIRYRIIIKTIMREKKKIHYSTTIWFINLFLCLKLWKFRQRKHRWTRNGKNWRKFWRGTWQKSDARKRWSMKQGRRAIQFILHH